MAFIARLTETASEVLPKIKAQAEELVEEAKGMDVAAILKGAGKGLTEIPGILKTVKANVEKLMGAKAIIAKVGLFERAPTQARPSPTEPARPLAPCAMCSLH